MVSCGDLLCLIKILKNVQSVPGSGQVEEPEEKYFPGSYQKGGGEEDDGAVDDRRDT